MDYSPREIKNLEDRIDRERRHYIYCSFEPVKPIHSSINRIKRDDKDVIWIVSSKTYIDKKTADGLNIRFMGRGYIEDYH